MTIETTTRTRAAAPAPPLRVTLSDAITHGVSLAVAGFSVPEAATEVASMNLEREAVDTFIFDGIASRIHAALGTRNGKAKAAPRSGGGRSRSGKTSVVARPHAARAWYLTLLAGTNYATADGSRRSLLDFSLADVNALLIATSAKRDGYAKLEAALLIARDALTVSGAKSVAKLPATEVERVALALR
jgi:hypothetical protein